MKFMKFMPKKFLSCLIFVFASFSLFCEGWFVCLGSFSIRSNAEKRLEELAENNISSFIYETEVGGQDLYRVLFDKEYDDRDTARLARNKIAKSSIIKRLGIGGLWICAAERSYSAVERSAPVVKQSEPVVERNVPAVERSVPVEEPGVFVEEPSEPVVVLKENKSDAIPLSLEKPYSVLVRSYKEKYAAENARDRLVEDEIDAYVLGKYDDANLFKFDVHAGAFAAEDETKDLIAKLKEIGIDGLETSDYNDISDSVKKYDEMVKSSRVVYDAGENSIPKTFPAEVKNCINEFPLNKNFQVEQVVIFDFDNIDDEEFFDFMSKCFNNFNTKASSSHAASFSLYRDELFGKEVKVFIAQGDNGQFAPSDYEKETDNIRDYKIRDGVLKSKLYEAENGIYLFGSSDDGSMRIEMLADNFTMDEFKEFMDNSYSDSELLIYPQLRKSLSILPDNPDKKRDFQTFVFKRVEKDYVEEKDYADWAWGMYGHWKATAYLRQADESVSVSFFDLDYDYNAKKFHDMFMSEKETKTQNENNHSEKTHGIAGWFLDNDKGKELSFANKSYIIAIHTYYPSVIELPEIHDFANDLKIW